jgi:hypothetical protein
MLFIYPALAPLPLIARTLRRAGLVVRAAPAGRSRT